jgi:uncharacterized protein (DUF305 family)
MEHGMDHGDMPGMMSDEDMTALEEASGAEFDRMWMKMMIEHHQGAIDMAQDQLDEGANAEAKTLAQEIIDTQEAEIATMREMLDQA